MLPILFFWGGKIISSLKNCRNILPVEVWTNIKCIGKSIFKMSFCPLNNYEFYSTYISWYHLWSQKLHLYSYWPISEVQTGPVHIIISRVNGIKLTSLRRRNCTHFDNRIVKDSLIEIIFEDYYIIIECKD